MSNRKSQLIPAPQQESNCLDEYKDITAHLRQRHQAIWHTRNIYTVIMLAIVGLAYQVKSAGISLLLIVFGFTFAAVAMTVVVGVIEFRYSLTERELINRALELEQRLDFSQYSRIDALKKSHRYAFGKHAQIIYLLLATAYITAIVLRAFVEIR